MRRCQKCLMPDTRPGSIFKQGVCQACINYEKRKEIDWEQRRKHLIERLEGKNLLIAVSGGKDSHFMMKKLEDAGLLHGWCSTITVHDWFTTSKAGVHNLQNLKKRFNLDHFDWWPPRQNFIDKTRERFEKTGEALRWSENKIYSVPVRHKIAMNYDYVIFGEDSTYEYGTSETKTLDVDILFMSHYFPWSSTEHLKVAKECGFKDLTEFDDWKREGTVEQFEQIDSYGYMIHLWLKYPKFGFQRVTDIVSRRIREGIITKADGMELIQRNDPQIDPTAFNDFINILGYDEMEFWQIVKKFRLY